MANYSFRRSLPTAANGQTFERCNFAQLEPNTAIFTGVTGLTFKRCNLVNCTVPGDATVEDCNQSSVDRCTNLDASLVDKGQTACVENCRHVTEVDTITIDGVVVDTVYHYKDTIT
jgi:hypothetical protein